MRLRLTICFSLIALAVLGSEAEAHHSASRDVDKGEHILWHGTISKVSWDGAHVMYRIDVRDNQGQSVSWDMLGASPRLLMKRGIRKASVSVGTPVAVEGFLNPLNKQISPMYLDTGEQRYYVGYFLADGTFIGR